MYCWEGFKKLFLKTRGMREVIESSEPPIVVMQGDPANLLCLNINSYSGGVQSIWEKAQYRNGDQV